MSATGIPLPTPEELAREYEARLAASARAHYTNARLLSEWMNDVRPLLAPSSVPVWEARSRILTQWLDASGVHVLAATPRDGLAFRAWLQKGEYETRRTRGALAATTVHKLLTHASLFANYLKDSRGLLRVNPFRDVTRAYQKQHKAALRPDMRGLTEAEARAILEGARGLDDFVLFLVLVKTGVRRDEAVHVRADQIDWNARTVDLDAHAKRSYGVAYFDDELAYFLKLKVERNTKEHPNNAYLFPSPTNAGKPLSCESVNETVRMMVKRSTVGLTIKDWSDNMQKVSAHTTRRAFTSWLKRARASAPTGCPSHIVATLRGDSIRTKSELIPHPTQGIYTKLDAVDGVDELRYWYDKSMPTLDARDVWGRVMPSRWNAETIGALIRGCAQRNGRT